MQPLSSSRLLDVWESAHAAGQVERALRLLEAASPEIAPDRLAQLPVGRRDARLLVLREWMFGPHLVSRASCPACGESLELSFTVGDIRVENDERIDETFTARLDDYEVRFRLPNSQDLLAVADCVELQEARRLLFARLILSASHNDEAVGVENLPPEVVDHVVEEMSLADPQGDVKLALGCPACGQKWEALFDIVSFFWSEIDAWARRVLQEVHIIARAYGWPERETLALSPQRRRLYLEMILG
jgi:uncharacterized protein (UPF0212 family)